MFRNPKFQIVVGSLGLSILLGWAVDLITAHVAVEYFSVHHPKVLNTDAPLALALYWGFAASWWFGLIAGGLLSWMNGRRAEPLPVARVLWMVAKGCAVIWLIMMLILVGIYAFASIIPDAHRKPSFEHDRRLMAVALAHLSEYALGAAVVVLVAWRVYRAPTVGTTQGAKAIDA